MNLSILPEMTASLNYVYSEIVSPELSADMVRDYGRNGRVN